jgi:dienelactone hydrolase
MQEGSELAGDRAGYASGAKSHGYFFTRPVRASRFPAHYTFVLTRDELYVPIALRKPEGDGPFPLITMGRGNGRGGMPLIEAQVERLAGMQDLMIERGYAVAYVNYRNEIPHLYNVIGDVHDVADDISGEGRTLKAVASLDSDDMLAILDYLRELAFVRADAIGAVGVSHGGEIILKALTQTRLAAAVVIEGASHEFLIVNTGPDAPRRGGILQYQDKAVVRSNADKARAMERIRRIDTPMLHIGRDSDHLQGIFELVHEWMREAGKDSTWVSMRHQEHGHPFIYRNSDGSYEPDAVQQKAFDLFMDFFDARLKPTASARPDAAHAHHPATQTGDTP